MTIKKVKEMQFTEVGYNKENQKYYMGNRHRNIKEYEDIEVEILEFENKDNNYTTLESLLNGSYAQIHCNTNSLKEYILNPQGVLCVYDKVRKIDNRNFSTWEIVIPLGIDYYTYEEAEPTGNMHFDCVGSINFHIG